MLKSREMLARLEDFPSGYKVLMLMMPLLVNAVVCDYCRVVLHAKGCSGLGVTEGSVGFIALVRVQAVILLSTYLTR